MEPHSFQFVVTMPGDRRLVGAVRDLAAQAGSYAKLPSNASKAFADEVVDAAHAAIASTGRQDTPIEFLFSGDADRIRVTINWSRNGSRETRQVQQPLSS